MLGAIAVLLALDLGSKSIAFRTIADHPVTIDKARVLDVMAHDPRAIQSLVPDHDALVVIPRVFEFKLVLNAGAVFGAGSGRRWFFVGFTLIALGFALFYFARWTARRDRPTHLALALIIAGGLGNLYDRIMFACVRDFLHPLPGVTLPFGWRWPVGGGREIWPYVSNVADAFLLVGIAMALVRLWSQDRREVEAARAHAPDTPDAPPGDGGPGAPSGPETGTTP